VVGVAILVKLRIGMISPRSRRSVVLGGGLAVFTDDRAANETLGDLLLLCRSLLSLAALVKVLPCAPVVGHI